MKTFALVGELVFEIDMVMYTMTRLGPKCTPLITTITTRIEKMYLDKLHGMLLNFEQRLIQDNEIIPAKLEDPILVNYVARHRSNNSILSERVQSKSTN